jgi:hypothetical protein
LTIALSPSRGTQLAVGAVLGTTTLCALVIALFESRSAAVSGGFRRALPETD